VLNKLCKSKATGLDQILARLVRECAVLISSSITNIFNLSLTLGTFPEDWKCAKVTPIFKQGTRNEMNNYRPISVISVMAKAFERIIYNQLYAYMLEHDLLSEYQTGFRSLHSTVKPVFHFKRTVPKRNKKVFKFQNFVNVDWLVLQ
jgi:hypothetical protein